MEMFTFKKGDIVKTCHCHKGVREALLADGWIEEKPSKPKKEKKEAPKEDSKE